MMEEEDVFYIGDTVPEDTRTVVLQATVTYLGEKDAPEEGRINMIRNETIHIMEEDYEDESITWLRAIELYGMTVLGTVRRAWMREEDNNIGRSIRRRTAPEAEKHAIGLGMDTDEHDTGPDSSTQNKKEQIFGNEKNETPQEVAINTNQQVGLGKIKQELISPQKQTQGYNIQPDIPPAPNIADSQNDKNGHTNSIIIHGVDNTSLGSGEDKDVSSVNGSHRRDKNSRRSRSTSSTRSSSSSKSHCKNCSCCSKSRSKSTQEIPDDVHIPPKIVDSQDVASPIVPNSNILDKTLGPSIIGDVLVGANAYSPYAVLHGSKPVVTFNGTQDIAEFFEKLEMLYNRNPIELRRQMKIHLEGRASAFFNLVQKDATYEEIKEYFIANFGNVGSIYRKLDNIQFSSKKGDMFVYFEDLNKVWRLNDTINEEMKLYVFRKGLEKDAYWILDKISHCTTVKQAVIIANSKWVERAERNPKKTQNSDSKDKKQRRFRGLCNNCGKRGHKAAGCTNPKKQKNVTDSGATTVNPNGCFSCGDTGHFKRDCPNNQQNVIQDADDKLKLLPKDTTYYEKLENTNAIFSNFEINGKIVRAFMDAGSRYSIISEETVNYLQLQKFKADKSVGGFTEGIKCFNSAVWVTISGVTALAYVDTETSLQFLMGRNFMFSLGITIKHPPTGVAEISLENLEEKNNSNILKRERWKESAWKLNPIYLERAEISLKKKIGVDLFADAANKQVKNYCSLDAGANSLGDAFARNWDDLAKVYGLLYANAPWISLLQVIEKIIAEKVDAILVVPEFTTAPWWLKLMDIVQCVLGVYGRKNDIFFPKETGYKQATGAPYFNTWIVYVSGADKSTYWQNLDLKDKTKCFLCKSTSHKTRYCPKGDRIDEAAPYVLDTQKCSVIEGGSEKEIDKNTFFIQSSEKIRIEPYTTIDLPIRAAEATIYDKILFTCEANVVKDGLNVECSVFDKDNPYVLLKNNSNVVMELSEGVQVGKAEPCQVLTDYSAKLEDIDDIIALQQIQKQQIDEINCKIDEAVPAIDQINEQLQVGDIEPEELQKLKDLLKNYTSMISEHSFDLGTIKDETFKIQLNDEEPTVAKGYRKSKVESDIQDDMVDLMEKYKVIRSSYSNWSHDVVLVNKKNTSEKRFAVDYSRTNDKTVKDQYPLPRIDDILDSLGNKKVFSVLDMTQSYWQFLIDEESKKYTAFKTRKGLFEFNRLPFGLCNAPSMFQRLMDKVMKDLLGKICKVYLDDLIIFSDTVEEHLQHIKLVLDKFKELGIKIRLKKCEFFKKELKYLGYIINKDGVLPVPEKIEAILNFKEPKNVKQLQMFLGMTNYYRPFIENYAVVTQPLVLLLRKKQDWIWDEKQVKAFNDLKILLTQAPILMFPNWDKQFLLYSDACDISYGSVLMQEDDNGVLKPIAYFSRAFKGSQLNWHITVKEAYSVIQSILFFRPYLHGRYFKVFTDHIANVRLLKHEGNVANINRWRLKIADFMYDVFYVKGKDLILADAISRSVMKIEDAEFNSFIDKVLFYQQTDNFCMMVLEKIKEDKVGLWKNYFIDENDGLLKRIAKLHKISYSQVVVPTVLREDIMIDAHDSPYAGHLSYNKTYENIFKKYYWDSMKQDIKQWINSCVKCNMKDKLMGNNGLLQPIKAEETFQIVGVDIVGPLPITKDKNEYFIILVDYFSKYVRLIPIEDSNSEVFASVIITEWISIFGIPELFISDADSKINSADLLKIYELLEVEKNSATPYHQQANGCTENLVKQSKIIMGKMVSEEHDDWDLYLAPTQAIINSRVTVATGFTPNELVFGKNLRNIVDCNLSKPKASKIKLKKQYHSEMIERMEFLHNSASENNEKLKQVEKEFYDKRMSNTVFQEKDLVYVYIPTGDIGGAKSFTTYWYGPYVVVKVYEGGLSYDVRDCLKGDKAINKVHANRMKIFETCDFRTSEDSLYPDDEYEIQAVVGKSGVGGKVKYLLTFKGFPGERFWTDAKDINAPELIKKYEDQLKANIPKPSVKNAKPKRLTQKQKRNLKKKKS